MGGALQSDFDWVDVQEQTESLNTTPDNVKMEEAYFGLEWFEFPRSLIDRNPIFGLIRPYFI